MLCCFGLFPLYCIAEDIACPRTIITTEAAISIAPAWEPVTSQKPHPLENAEVYDGHPSELASLVPDAGSDRGTIHLAIWNLPSDRERDVWIGCHYRGSTVILARKIDRSARRCTFEYKREGRATPGKLISLDCR
jgi:hypothetical protein